MSELVTIITRTKDRPLLLARALDSVASQSFTDYRQIVVNDGGDLREVNKLVERLEPQARSRVEVVDNSATMTTREGAIHAGLQAHWAELFCIHDDDDTWDKDFLHSTVAYLQENQQMAGVAVETAIVFERIDSENEQIQRLETLPIGNDANDLSLLKTLLVNIAPPISQLFRRRIADEIGHWDSTLPVQADWDFNLRILTKHPVGYLPGQTLAFWHHRKEATDASANSVFSEEDSHLKYNLQIRDTYLRADLAGDSANPGLGMLLATAYFHEQITKEFEHLHTARDLVHADLVQAFQSTHAAIESLSRQIEDLRNRPLSSRFARFYSRAHARLFSRKSAGKP